MNKRPRQHHKSSAPDQTAEIKGKGQTVSPNPAVEARRREVRQAKRERESGNVTPITAQQTPTTENTGPGKSRIITVGVIALILVIAVALLAIPGLRVKNLRVSGLYRCTEDDILKAVNIEPDRLFLKEYGGNLKLFFKGRYGPIEERIERELGRVEDAVVTFRYPSTLNIDIVERVSLAFVKIPDGYALLDKNSIVTVIVQEKPELPAIEGLIVNRAQTGQQIKTALPEMLEMSLSIMNILVQADMKEPGDLLIEQITAIKPTEHNEIYLTVRDGEQTYRVLCRHNAQLQQHFEWLKRVLNTGMLDGKGNGYIDLTGKNPYFKPDGK